MPKIVFQSAPVRKSGTDPRALKIIEAAVAATVARALKGKRRHVDDLFDPNFKPVHVRKAVDVICSRCRHVGSASKFGLPAVMEDDDPRPAATCPSCGHVGAATEFGATYDDDVEKTQMRTLVEKIDAAHQTQATLREAILDYQRVHKCSREAAIDKILLSPAVSEHVRLSKRETALEVDIRKRDEHAAATGAMKKFDALVDEVLRERPGLSREQATWMAKRSDEGHRLIVQYYEAAHAAYKAAATTPYGGGGSYDPSAHRGRAANPGLSGDVLNVKTSMQVLDEIAADLMRANPSWSRAMATNRAADSPQFTAAWGAEKARAMMQQGADFGGGYAPGFRPGG